MLQILLTILKILGILILVILGVLLAVILVVLLVPIRYSGDASFDGKPKGGVLVSWLFRILTVRVDYDGEALKALVKIFWFRVFGKTLWPSVEEEESVQETADDGFFAETGAMAEMIPEPVTRANDALEPVASEPVASEPVATEPVVSEPVVTETVEPEPVASEPVASEPVRPEPETAEPVMAEPELTSQEEKPPFIERLAVKIQSMVTKLVDKVKTTYTGLSGKYTAGQEKINMVRTFLGDEQNKSTLRLLWRQFKKLIKHVLPKKMNGRVRFGFDDPATTGQILTYISPFYGVYAKSVAIEPVFDEKVMEGELHLRGRIRLGTLLWTVVRVFFDKNFRTLLKKFMNRSK